MQMHERGASRSRLRMKQMCVLARTRALAIKWRCSNVQFLLLLVSATALALVSYQVEQVEGRYLLPTNYRLGNYRDVQRADGSMPAFRRQDFDDSNASNDADEEPDDVDDQNAAASYQNQDDRGNQDGDGRASDGFDDNEPDGPYEETPVEQEGQADLERFFDDHLGASDRDGMDKENLPTNLIASLSAPPRLNNFGPQVVMAAPSVPIASRTVEPPQERLLAALPTIQTTSFIRLPDEKKLIVTNQITRNTIGGPLKYADRSEHTNREPAPYSADLEHEPRLAPTSSPMSPPSALPNDPASVSLDIELEPSHAARQQQMSSPLSPFHNQQDARDDKITPRGSEVVITEDDDNNRICITNDTDKPFRIDAMGGFDPEADFQHAAEELEMAPEKLSRRALATDQRDEEESGPENMSSNKEQEAGTDRYVSALRDSPDMDMFERASETDEITFGQDDPYQTDLEAEMRHQQYDKVGHFMSKDPNESGSSNVPRESGEESERPEEGGDSKESTDFNNDDGKVNPNDDDADIDNEYKPPKPEARQYAERVEPRRRRVDEADEGGWVNDGADEMDIPSQSHQNFILDKAAKHDAMVRKAALDEMEAAKKLPEQPTDESGQTSSEDEENQRMPNADYLKGDLKIEDDSGYAA